MGVGPLCELCFLFDRLQILLEVTCSLRVIAASVGQDVLFLSTRAEFSLLLLVIIELG